MDLPKIDEAGVRQLATGQTFSRGQEYYEAGWVLSLIRRERTLYAEVQGNDYKPYEVTFTLDTKGVVETFCTCSYDWGGICKHTVAALLTYIHRPERVEERPSVETLLDHFDIEQLKALLIELTKQRPGLINFIESRVPYLEPTATGTDASKTSAASPHSPAVLSSTAQNQTELTPTPFRQQVHAILHSLDDIDPAQAYSRINNIVAQLNGLLDQARVLIEAGYGRNALIILEAVTDEYVAKWYDLDGSGAATTNLFVEISLYLAEALLGTALTPAEREEWITRLSDWQNQVSYYGIYDAFDVAHTAAVQGWDYPPLKRVLEGDIAYQMWEGDIPWFADELALLRLKVLARQRRYQEYLNLARAENRIEQYVTMLVQMEQVDDAIAYGLNELETAAPALALAKALHAKGETDAALRIAERGLKLQQEPGTRIALASWLRDTAHQVGQSELALETSLFIFKQKPKLADYKMIQLLGGDGWPQLQASLLHFLRQNNFLSAADRLDIFLYEGLIDDAVDVVEAEPQMPFNLVEPVIDTALDTHTEWVIRTCCRRAEEIIEQEEAANHYETAMRWFNKARLAYMAGGRLHEWRIYLDGVLARLGRRHSISDRLAAIR